MLQLLKKELDAKNALTGELPPVLEMIADAIPFQTIPRNMKLTIAKSEMTLFASQFRRNIHHWDGGEVPINGIGFIITGSGAGKDSGVNAARKCFNVGYDIINEHRNRLAKQSAMQEAEESGDENPTEWETYKAYYRAPNPLFVAPSTTEGLVQHFNDLDTDGIGAGYMYSGEIGAELSQNPLMVENIKLLSELYDLGNKEVKVLKGRENQSKEIKGLPTSALFVGSPANILYDEAIKKKFSVEISSKLARRSDFCFCPWSVPEPSFKSITEMLAAEEAIENAALAARELLSNGIATLARENLQNRSLVEVDPAVRRLFLTYKRYNSEVAETLPKLYPMSALVRRHLQWKALKFAGAIAIFNQHPKITEEDFIYAIRFCELLDKDMAAFEVELVKEPYEVFADYMKEIVYEGKSVIGLHALRKMKYIPMSGNPKQKMDDLVHLAAAYDTSAIYSVKKDEIHYEEVVKTDVLSISFKEIDNSGIFDVIEKGLGKAALTKEKEKVSYEVAKGLETGETTFEDLGYMLTEDYAYSNFIYKDGVRGRDTVIGGTKWLVLDIDTSNVTASEAHFMLQDINHHIALSSDKDNEFKFRVVIELDSVVDLEPHIWRHFVLAVSEHLSLSADILAQSAIFYSYSGRAVQSVTDAEPLEARDFIMAANDKASQTTPVKEKALSNSQREALIADELTTFARAFDATPGARSREMIKAAYYARDLMMSKEAIIELMHRINAYWLTPMTEERMQNTIINQIMRF